MKLIKRKKTERVVAEAIIYEISEMVPGSESKISCDWQRVIRNLVYYQVISEEDTGKISNSAKAEHPWKIIIYIEAGKKLLTDEILTNLEGKVNLSYHLVSPCAEVVQTEEQKVTTAEILGSKPKEPETEKGGSSSGGGRVTGLGMPREEIREQLKEELGPDYLIFPDFDWFTKCGGKNLPPTLGKVIEIVTKEASARKISFLSRPVIVNGKYVRVSVSLTDKKRFENLRKRLMSRYHLKCVK